MNTRRQQAQNIRNNAAELAANRPHPQHINNKEEYEYRRPKKDGEGNEPSHIANFTKGLPHDEHTGLLLNSADYDQFVLGIQSGDTTDFARTPLGPAELPKVHGCLSKQKIDCDDDHRSGFWKSQIAKEAEKDEETNKSAGAKLRAWESAGAGLVFDLEGPDAQAVTMPPAPRFDSSELAAEIAEVYSQALLRDIHFSQLRSQDYEVIKDPQEGPGHTCKIQLSLQEAKELLNNVQIDGQNWFSANCCNLTDDERARQRSLVTEQNIFRGIAPGDDVGPYLSQFLLIGNDSLGKNAMGNIVFKKDAGHISYGAIRIDQRVRKATPCKDFMTNFETWLDVQNGADLRGLETYVDAAPGKCREFPAYRIMTTPRDLATYVHYDALYEAYLNACLILLGMGAPFDPGIPFQKPDVEDKQQGFAHFGGPQILTLVCEAATRGLKAVRFQKFNVHRRLRPEALGGLVDRYKHCKGTGDELKPVAALVKALENVGLLSKVAAHNHIQNQNPDYKRLSDPSSAGDNYFLPMAFPEGSPMHPSYGAGHATVAGACVTMLKAFFDHGWQLNLGMANGKYVSYEPNQDGSGLQQVLLDCPLTVEGELNKIAANISIGRDWAGVHYFTDYIESLRLGEKIAIGILEEQKLTYGENFTMTVPLYDGGSIQI
ncbi:vanadium-dependent haloperoxidase [Acaryochloris marina]|uniref:vanadium-dependent haloperoxidase n=1 Tax=Acaryochloris marina TaxID=155978 RepID=UPI0021C48E93|nr:vanadium-dependent haloperoxidase [Acaryochloris marina]BDM78818.1 phosphoesterase [Acaryochloris marina MBIC10699]